jgi:hypothetical protein
VAYENPKAIHYACCGREEKETSHTIVGYKYRCQGELANDDASLLRIFDRLTNFG